MIRLIAIAFALLMAGSASAQTVRFPSVAVGSSAAGPEISGWMYKPSGAGPFAGPRGEKSVCGRGNVASGNMRASDVAGAIDFLNAQPFVRQGDIGLIGHSRAGGA